MKDGVFVMRNILLILLVLLGISFGVNAQTSAELRERYGTPQKVKFENGEAVLERFLVRPEILMTIKYAAGGAPREAVFEPVPSSTSKASRPPQAPDGDYMSTAEVIKVINELLSEKTRGKKLGEAIVNGGDREMRLHHPGCNGVYMVYFEHANVSASTSCWGGTFSATIRWGEAPLPWATDRKPRTAG
jgi:hypothetical protein